VSLPRGWLQRMLVEAFERRAGGPPERLRTREHARRLALASLDHRGLLYGAPVLRREQSISRDAGELLLLVRWLAVVADHVDLIGRVLDDDAHPEHAIDNRVRALACALALVFGSEEDALVLSTFALHQRVERALSNLERELQKRRYLQGNPIVGLTLFPSFSAIDARAVVLATVDVYRTTPVTGAAEHMQKALMAERTATLAAIAGLSEWRELIDADFVRSASLWQVKSLGLQRADTQRLLEQAKNPGDLSRLVTLTPAGAQQRIVRAVALAAWLDGRQSPEERAFLRSMAEALGVTQSTRKRAEKRTRAFIETHKDAYNPLTLAAGFAAGGPPISVRLARALSENIEAVWNEIRETGDLAVLLAKRASGQRLGADEQRRMREQLVDVAKTVPGLAMFTLPGGFVLLPILLKLIPFDMRPSSWRRKEQRFHAFATGDDDVATEDDLLPR
jgi:LETM1-like protein